MSAPSPVTPKVKFKVKLVDDWKQFTKWAEVRLSAIGAAASVAVPVVISKLPELGQIVPHAWASVPDDLKQSFPNSWQHGIGLACFFLAIIGGRLFEKVPVNTGDQQ